eukprot:Gregarina_sp_Pseudo_9__5043@NODE_52_length_4794_cov_43_386751_g49_i0_p5_GENE_NODE_52_length_4794_cov_43_386751_g49_i0NODE_52_length_4794_cov_43_386751_g49_i0_p5_ORF_typecomplete_len257_score65_63HSCB_C/PF07743_13/5e03HSCB_C/PF07743_13/3_5e05DnaJ/PF00226_31/0_083DnaJ/PF00226_31/1_6e03NinF/PF05810_12/0_12NinF/PF05810_12/2_6e03_NODE_52_length_4794_cov_43_386751_g49_i011281898
MLQVWGGAHHRIAHRCLATIADGASLQPFLQGGQECKHCGAKRDALSLYLCSACLRAGYGSNKVAAEINPYDFFRGLRDKSMNFNIDVASVEQEYKKRMWTLHPDMIQAKGGSERDIDLAAVESSHLRNSFNQLKDPVLRAEALARWSYSQAQAETDSITDKELIMEVLEDTEAIEDATDAPSVAQVQQKWQARLDEAVDILAKEFQRLEESGETASVLGATQFGTCGSVLQQLRLMHKVCEAARDKRVALGDKSE